MAHFQLVVQLPKPKVLGLGSLSIGSKGDAQFFEGDAQHDDRLLASMERVQIE